MDKENLIKEIMIIQDGVLTKSGLEKHTEEYLRLYLEQLQTNKRVEFLEKENREMEEKLEKNRLELKSLYRNTGRIIEVFKTL